MIRGGLRTRLIADSVRLAIIASLTGLGWFDGTIYDNPPGPRMHRPLRYVPRPRRWDEAIAPNAIAINADDTYDDAHGLGGEVEDTFELWVDVLAESQALAAQLALDVRDIALGKFPDLGRQTARFDVYDLRSPVPGPFTHVEVEAVSVDQAGDTAKVWQANWWMIRIDVVDDYADEFGVAEPSTVWSTDLAAAWNAIQAIEATA